MDKTRMLIVDDDRNFNLTLSKIMVMRDFDVEVAENGLDALEKVRRERFDVVLMDVKMPIMDGLESYMRMREIRPDIDVILMTASPIDNAMKDAIRNGAHAVVNKPLNINSLIKVIDRDRYGTD